ncbi:hypothetical protein [Lactiplantibacillus xiangfangensis]|uniref:hypothetical protein n=1 Tax=Lactiplantibacillus xiangfangensis TaxID=942150 RepID=UPI0038500373
MSEKISRLELALIDILKVINKYQITFGQYEELKRQLDQAIQARTIGDKSK